MPHGKFASSPIFLMVAVWSHAFQRTHFVIAQHARCNQEYLTDMVEILLMPKGRTTSWRSNTNHWKLWSVAIQIENMSHYKATGNFVLLSSPGHSNLTLWNSETVSSVLQRRDLCASYGLFWEGVQLMGGLWVNQHSRVFGRCKESSFRLVLPEIARHRLTPTPASDTAKLHKPFWAQAAKKPVEDVHDDGSIMCYLCLRKMCWTSLRDFWKQSGSPSCCISEFATLSPTCQWGLLDFMSAILPPPPPPPDLNCKL